MPDQNEYGASAGSYLDPAMLKQLLERSTAFRDNKPVYAREGTYKPVADRYEDPIKARTHVLAKQMVLQYKLEPAQAVAFARDLVSGKGAFGGKQQVGDSLQPMSPVKSTGKYHYEFKPRDEAETDQANRAMMFAFEQAQNDPVYNRQTSNYAFGGASDGQGGPPSPNLEALFGSALNHVAPPPRSTTAYVHGSRRQ